MAEKTLKDLRTEHEADDVAQPDWIEKSQPEDKKKKPAPPASGATATGGAKS